MVSFQWLPFKIRLSMLSFHCLLFNVSFLWLILIFIFKSWLLIIYFSMLFPCFFSVFPFLCSSQFSFQYLLCNADLQCFLFIVCLSCLLFTFYFSMFTFQGFICKVLFSRFTFQSLFFHVYFSIVCFRCLPSKIKLSMLPFHCLLFTLYFSNLSLSNQPKSSIMPVYISHSNLYAYYLECFRKGTSYKLLQSLYLQSWIPCTLVCGSLDTYLIQICYLFDLTHLVSGKWFESE